MNTLLRITISLFFGLAFVSGVFAESGTIDGSGQVQSKAKTTQTVKVLEDTDTEEASLAEAKKEKIKQEISSYIIDSYKAQWDKILKDIDQTLQKTAPEKSDRIEAYTKIQSSLEARKEKNNDSKKISETSKMIVNAFLTHMIESIEKRIAELKA